MKLDENDNEAIPLHVSQKEEVIDVTVESKDSVEKPTDSSEDAIVEEVIEDNNSMHVEDIVSTIIVISRFHDTLIHS